MAHIGSPMALKGPTRALAIIVGVGSALRLLWLSQQPLWLDEVASFNNAQVVRQSGPLAVAQQDHVPPLSNILEALSISLGTPNEFWMRLPAALAGVLGIVMMYATTRRILGDERIAIGAALFTAVAPFAIWYSQEARMYSLLLLLALAYVWACWGLIDGTVRRIDWVLITVTAGLGLWVHHYMALLMLTFGLFLLAKVGVRDRRLWQWVAIQLVAIAAFIPWLILTKGQGNATGFEKSGQRPVASLHAVLIHCGEHARALST